MPPPSSDHEARRLEALRRHRILDTPAEQAFDDFAFLASTICETPIALMTLVDHDRQWFKANVGLAATETPREHAFCAHTILQHDLLVVEDATRDARFAGNPLVTAEPYIRFYAGAPLVDAEGHALGSLCVIDRQPRPLTDTQSRALEALARQVAAQLELRRTSALLAETLADLKTLRGLLPICCHCKGIRNDAGYWESVEAYVESHSDASFTHGICPRCLEQNHPEVYAQLLADGKL